MDCELKREKKARRMPYDSMACNVVATYVLQRSDIADLPLLMPT